VWQANAGLREAELGNATDARQDAMAPLNTMAQSYWLPSIRAAMELNRKQPDKAIALLQMTSPLDLGQAPPFELGPMYPVYLRGEALLMKKHGKEAAEEFQKIIDHPGVVLNFVLGALARLDLARAYALESDTAKARTAYQNFFALWKDADPDIPILKQAKAEYAKQQQSTVENSVITH
jgi:eukaryotic-like serine/threonine-protein kinase